MIFNLLHSKPCRVRHSTRRETEQDNLSKESQYDKSMYSKNKTTNYSGVNEANVLEPISQHGSHPRLFRPLVASSVSTPLRRVAFSRGGDGLEYIPV
jgi:hypothetical protein